MRPSVGAPIAVSPELANNHLVYRARQLQEPGRARVVPQSSPRRKGPISGSTCFLYVQLVAFIALVLFGTRRILFSVPAELSRHPGDDSGYEFVDGLPSKQCYGRTLHLKQRYYVAFTRALDRFARTAPAAVLNASSDFQDWEGYLLQSRKRMQLFQEYVKASFASFAPGMTVVNRDALGRGTSYLTYLRVWKSANDAIRMNLVAAAGNDVTRKVSGTRKRRMGEANARFLRKSSVFTFVREPIEHFVAGYNELEFRWFLEFTNYSGRVEEVCQVEGCVFHTFDIGSPERVWAFVGDMLLGKLRTLREVGHVYPQSGVLAPGLRLDFVGKVETFDADWKRLMDTYLNADGYVFDTSLGRHNSSGFEAGRSAKELVLHDRHLVQVLEELFVIDYKCWGYDFPVPLDDDDGSNGPQSTDGYDRDGDNDAGGDRPHLSTTPGATMADLP
jgi:hypothetical protein